MHQYQTSAKLWWYLYALAHLLFFVVISQNMFVADEHQVGMLNAIKNLFIGISGLFDELFIPMARILVFDDGNRLSLFLSNSCFVWAIKSGN